MSKIEFFVISLLLSLGVPDIAPAEGQTVAFVSIVGNHRISTETYSYYISTKPGDPYDEAKLRQDFRRLWQLGFLDDLKITRDDLPEGIKITFQVTERSVLKMIEFVGNKELTQASIDEKLKDEKLSFAKDQPIDQQVVHKTIVILEKLLFEKGFHFGSATSATDSAGHSGVKLTFQIDEGPKVDIGDIVFEGNKVLSSGKLQKAMKDIKEHSILSFVTKKDDYEKEKFNKDMERLNELYIKNGYIKARISEPKIELYEDRGMFGKKQRMRITMGVQEGEQYRTGEIKFSGNKVLDTPQLKKFLTLKKGDIFNSTLLRENIEEAQQRYGQLGYIYASLGPVFDVHDSGSTVNVNIEVQENGAFFVNKIEFEGNEYTRDKVIRREMLLAEGELLNTALFRKSVERIYRLGFFEDVKPNIVPIEEQNKADVFLQVKENKKNEIQLGGGYSALDGIFGTIMFSTRNLFGTGKIFSINLQSGTLTRNLSLQLTEPYFLDRRLSLGFTGFDTRNDYYTYIQESRGGTVMSGFPIIEEFWGSLSYTYRIVDIDIPEDYDLATYEALYPNYEDYLTSGHESRLIPQLLRNTIDNPNSPTRGTRFAFSNEIVGGFLGGDYDYIKPSASFTGYFPGLTRKHYTAVNIEGGYASGIGGQALPFYERFYIGGEQTIRGYEQRIISPIQIDPDTDSQVLIGGNKLFLLNAEYVIPFGSIIKLAGFIDYGNVFAEGESIDFTDMRGSTGVELRFTLPVISAPFRFIYAINFNRGELMTLPEANRPERSLFRFSVGTTF